MITLRCTQKLLKFLGIVPNKNLELTTARLGDWYANLVPTLLGDLIIFVNEKSLLTVAIPVWNSDHLVPLFRLRVANLLEMLRIDPGGIADELCHFDQVQFGRTVSRTILGSMNDIAYQYQVIAEEAGNESEISLSAVELDLSRMPSKPIDYNFPSDIARELLNPGKSLS
jgi:hypothetical protein